MQTEGKEGKKGKEGGEWEKENEVKWNIDIEIR